jgi:hypothetical protein
MLPIATISAAPDPRANSVHTSACSADPVALESGRIKGKSTPYGASWISYIAEPAGQSIG